MCDVWYNMFRDVLNSAIGVFFDHVMFIWLVWCITWPLQVAKVSLDPGKRPKTRPQAKSQAKQNGTVSPENRTSTPTTKTSLTPEGKSPTPTGKPPTPEPQTNSEDPRPFSPPTKVLNIVRSSKFRHIQGGTMHRSTHIEKLPKLSVAIPGESNAFQVRGENRLSLCVCRTISDTTVCV